MDKEAKIFVAGHRGLVGSAITRRLQKLGYHNLLLRTSAELDLKDSGPVNDFLQKEKPDYVFLAAAKVGGIHANNSFPADFIYDNLSVQNSVIHGCYKAGIKRLMFLGSSCVYPRECPQPIKEEYLLTGPLEKTNDAYAIAKIAGIKMCESYNRQYGTRFVAVMPTNLYGPFDNYDLENSHVLPAMLRKFHEAMERGETVSLWGSGKPRREFLHSDDMASACVFLMNLPDDQLFAEGFPLINIGCGEDVSIKELAEMIARTVGFTGSIEWDSSKPDGTPRKLLDVGRLNRLGWHREIELSEGLKLAYQSFLKGETRQHR
ncbi:MAG: GDP-L-fucose synthase family protein [Candidatus Rifleibacteriota bacterium]